MKVYAVNNLILEERKEELKMSENLNVWRKDK